MTVNEIFSALNNREKFILSLVEIEDGQPAPRYMRQMIFQDPAPGVISLN